MSFECVHGLRGSCESEWFFCGCVLDAGLGCVGGLNEVSARKELKRVLNLAKNHSRGLVVVFSWAREEGHLVRNLNALVEV